PAATLSHVVAWRNDAGSNGDRLPDRNRNLRGHLHRGGARADFGEKISPGHLLADHCRDDNSRDHAGGLLRPIARHRLHRWVGYSADLRDRVPSYLALVDREYLDRDGKHAKGRNL